MRKIIIYGIVLLSCISISYFLGKSERSNTGDVSSNIKYVEGINLRDTSFYTGKDVSQYRFNPLKLIKKGVIPNANAAAKIAYDYVTFVYGEKCAKEEQPYNVQLINDQIWVIQGSLPQTPPLLTSGGVFYLTIEKYTGKIWSIRHEK